MLTAKFADMAKANAEKKKPVSGQTTTTTNGTTSTAVVVAPAPPARLVANKPKVELRQAPAVWIAEFLWKEVRYATKTRGVPAKGVPPMIPLRSPTLGPMCVEFRRGGTIPQSIGISINKRGKMKLAITLDDLSEKTGLDRAWKDLVTELRFKYKEWFPNAEITHFEDSVGRLLGEEKPSKDGGEALPQLSSFSINEKDLYPIDEFHPPALQITTTLPNGETKQVYDLNALPGQRWETMTAEFQFLVPGTSEKEGPMFGQPFLTVARRVRRLHFVVNEDSFHTVYPHQKATHDAAECKRKHNSPMLVTEFKLLEHTRIGSLQTKGQANFCSMVHVGAGDVIVKLVSGGTLPPFVISRNREGDLVFSASVEDPKEEQALDAIAQELKLWAVKNRNELFPGSDLPDEVIAKMFCKPLLGAKSKKPEYADLPRQVNMIFSEDKIGTTVHMLDSFGMPITDPMTQLPGKRWQEIWIHLRCLYDQVKTAGVLWETGFSRRLLFMQLAPSMDDWDLTSSEPSAKRAKV